VTWTLSEIEAHWFPDQGVVLPPDAAEAISLADEVRGREWVMNTTNPSPGVRSFGVGSFLPVYVLGTRLALVRGATGFDGLVARLRNDDRAAHSELAAIDLLCPREPDARPEIEFEPAVAVGDHERHPDFRIKRPGDAWTYVEVTQLHRSDASSVASALIRRLSEALMELPGSFMLEAVLLCHPDADEETQIIEAASELCKATGEQRRLIEHVAWLIRKPDGNVAVVEPTVIDGDSEPRMAIAHASGGAGGPQRQVIVRVPFTDQRADRVLKEEAKQLPKNESGLVMVDVGGQPSAFDAWPALVTRRCTPNRNTRIAGVCLFMHAIHGVNGWMPSAKLVTNPHASVPLAPWIVQVVEDIREESRQRVGRSD
jgi:hypothetical protein